MSAVSNAVIAKHSDRNYPGVLIQGDSLRILLDEIEELQDEASSGDLEAISYIADHLQEQLVDILMHYEQVLNENGIEFPYMNSAKNKT